MHAVLYDFSLFGFLKDPWSLHTYGVLIATGFILGMNLSRRQAEREGEDPERIVDLAFYVLLFGLLGARFVFILTKFDEYASNPIDMFMFWRGGLVWYGGFIAAAGFMFYYARRNRLNFFKYADLSMPYVALAHAFGRLGCMAAGCCFGQPTDAPWGVVFPSGSMAHAAHRNEGLIGMGESALAVHPTQLYESGAEMMMFAILIAMRPHKRFHGQLLLTWLATYPIIRSFIETYRGDKERGIWALGMSTSQWISLLVAGFAVWLFFYLRKTRTEAEATA